MKESGIDWIGQIPEEWEVKDIKHIFEEIGSGSTPKSDNEIFYDGDINWIQSGDLYQTDTVTSVSKTISYQGFKSTSALKIYKHPFIALAMYGASVGNVAISCIDACVNQAVVVMLGSSEKVGFGKYAIEASKSNLIFSAQGGTQPNISQNLIKNWSIPQPDSSEQTKIADFLDKKTAQLDKAKALLEEQIQKLKDYRASLIYETVTKGLDKTSPMKDSGIDWIGQVPGGWGVGKVKYFSQISAGATPDRNNSLFWNGNINWMSSGEVNQGIVKHTSETITDLALKRTSTKLLPNGTVMLALNGQGKTKGTAAVLAIESASNQSLASFIVDNKILNNMYLYYFFVANYYNIRGLKGEDRDGLNLQLVSNIVIPLFEFEEQQKIVDFLDKKTVQIDKLIQIKNQQIENINKQRQTLIYDYVTGKRRV